MKMLVQSFLKRNYLLQINGSDGNMIIKGRNQIIYSIVIKYYFKHKKIMQNIYFFCLKIKNQQGQEVHIKGEHELVICLNYDGLTQKNTKGRSNKSNNSRNEILSFINYILVLISLALSYRTIQFERGVEASVSFNTGHILERQSAVPRSVIVNIKFKKPFQVIPQVAAFPQLLDWERESPCGFRVEAIDIKLTDFNLRISAVSEKQLYSVYVNWIALFDPRISIVNFETTDLAAIATGSGNRQTSFAVPLNFPEVKSVACFLTGVRHVKTNAIIKVVVDSFTPKQVNIAVSTYWEAAVEMVRVLIIAGTDSALWASGPVIVEIPPQSAHPFVKRDPGEYKNTINVEIPKVWQSGPTQPLIGYIGYAVERGRNFRLNQQPVKVEIYVTYSQTTWGDTQVYAIYSQAALYVPDNNVKIFDPDCAEIFEKCDYQGDSLTICDRVPDLPKEGWAKPVKSIQVPANRRNLMGKEQHTEKIRSASQVYHLHLPNQNKFNFQDNDQKQNIINKIQNIKDLNNIHKNIRLRNLIKINFFILFFILLYTKLNCAYNTFIDNNREDEIKKRSRNKFGCFIKSKQINLIQKDDFHQGSDGMNIKRIICFNQRKTLSFFEKEKCAFNNYDKNKSSTIQAYYYTCILTHLKTQSVYDIFTKLQKFVIIQKQH
ncbi:hypothetical protein pb186bvf_000076 [Paramecium bursaria]